ncbi:hypothetical protein CV770_07385 [Bradyrhizobium sp. AC87j1]|nr:hypothetical protein CV770_07385 [Bradyrhizobium sp. AC87j1]
MPRAGAETVVSFVLRVGVDPTFGSPSRTTTALDCPTIVLLLVGSTALVAISLRAMVQRRFAMPSAAFSAALPSSR